MEQDVKMGKQTKPWDRQSQGFDGLRLPLSVTNVAHVARLPSRTGHTPSLRRKRLATPPPASATRPNHTPAGSGITPGGGGSTSSWAGWKVPATENGVLMLIGPASPTIKSPPTEPSIAPLLL